MVVENQADLRTRIRNILAPLGHAVTGFDDVTPALNALDNKDPGHFFLIISGYSLSGMTADQFLAHARERSPQTLRMLIADAAYVDAMISVVNTASLQACLTLPFEDGDLVNQVDQCGEAFAAALKLEALNQTIRRQNRQLFQIASNFKKKEAQNRAQMEARKKEIRMLQARIKAGKGCGSPEKAPSLEEILTTKGIDYTAQGFALEFRTMMEQIRGIMTTALFSLGKEPLGMAYQDAVFRAGQSRAYPETVDLLLPPLRMLIHQSRKTGVDLFGVDFKRHMDDHFNITLSDDRSRAVIRVTTTDPKLLNLTCIKYYLAWYKISYGLASDDQISAWLTARRGKKASGKSGAFVIAHGLDPVLPRNGEVRYHFPTDFLHAGKINEDGSINFRDRGEIPFVKAKTFLAAKIDSQAGKPGIDVTGREIPVPEPMDRTFEAGPGTVMSEDGKKIYAACEGQPHLDAAGKISVWPELVIDGDLGFETGDVIFDGNVVISGRVKEGFKVKAASLTAMEIQGAEIDISGDLNVSLGIVDTELVNVKGSVQAKFIRNSKINAFGDLIIQREIVDSRIRLSGSCINTSGSIINSEISANTGIDAGTIGTQAAKPSTLIVGKDEQTLRRVDRLDGEIRHNLERAADLTREINALEKEEQDLHGAIAHHATVQDRAQLGIRQIKEKIAGHQTAGGTAAYQKVERAMARLEKDMAEAEEAIDKGFERQDAISRKISGNQDRIARLQANSTRQEDEKKRLLEYTATKPPRPEVRVARIIRSGTRITGPNATLTLSRDDRHCRIAEVARRADDAGDVLFYEMKTGGY